MYLGCEAGVDSNDLSILVDRWQLTSDSNALIALILTSTRLELRKRDEPRLRAIYVDFLSSTLTYRCRFGGGRDEALAKAIGLKGKESLNVVDATAGWGRDAFIIASLGCCVIMLERHPVVAALLDNGLQRIYQNKQIGPSLRKNLTLVYASSFTALVDMVPPPDVVYIDPMYPYRQKSALVKKEMRILQSLVGRDDDAAGLLILARQLATKRVLVKRPHYATLLDNKPAHTTVFTKKHRFDIYMPL